MFITLSWDLLIIVFFAVIIAYSFIVGKEESVKIVVSSYVAAVAVQGFGNILEKVLHSSQDILLTLGFGSDLWWMSFVKLILFVAAIVFLAIRAGFDVQYKPHTEGWQDIALTGVIGFATAGLLVSTILTFIAGRPILDAHLMTAPTLAPLIVQSPLVWALVEYQDLWFSLPAFLLLGVGFVSTRS